MRTTSISVMKKWELLYTIMAILLVLIMLVALWRDRWDVATWFAVMMLTCIYRADYYEAKAFAYRNTQNYPMPFNVEDNYDGPF